MFELEEAIVNWRSGLLQNQSMLESDADELESHVREEVDSLMLAGLNAQEAFMVSSHRIGDNKAVDQEFAKVNPNLAWKRRAFWMLFGILISMLVGGIALICSSASSALMIWLNLNTTFSGVMTSLVHIGVFVVLLFTIVFGLGLFSKAFKEKLSVSKALILCIVCIFIIKALSVGFNIVRWRIFDMETIAKIEVVSHVTHSVWAILWPLILVMVLFILWPSRPQKVR